MNFKNIIILIFILTITVGYTNALDEVYLDLSVPKFNSFDTGTLNYENKKVNYDEDENYLKPSFQTIKKMFDEDFRSLDMIQKEQKSENTEKVEK